MEKGNNLRIVKRSNIYNTYNSLEYLFNEDLKENVHSELLRIKEILIQQEEVKELYSIHSNYIENHK